ncbi:MAG: MgtC/SapB family protein [Bdellovibrionales bacterium]|nr:MgtC/SapB family protein [Bdellovibrionales bacterium]
MNIPELQLNPSLLVYHLFHLSIAYLLALLIGFDREREARSAGLRTFPIVGMASCGFVLIGIDILGMESDSQARIIYGLMTGIGFIGGGAILKGDRGINGTATAASIWNTGAIGAAVAYRRYEIAVALTLLNFITLRLITPLKEVVGKQSES